MAATLAHQCASEGRGGGREEEAQNRLVSGKGWTRDRVTDLRPANDQLQRLKITWHIDLRKARKNGKGCHIYWDSREQIQKRQGFSIKRWFIKSYY